MEIQEFKSLLEFQKHFDTEDKCREYLERMRWDGKPVCPYCNSEKIHRLKRKSRLKCGNRECLKNFSATVGTIYENTKLPLVKWFTAMYLMTNHSKGISSLQLSKFLGITQKSAWFVLHRIREQLRDKAPKALSGEVEVDETYWGGKIKNKSKKVREAYKTDKFSHRIKTPIIGMLQRGGKIITRILPDTHKETIVPLLKAALEPDAVLITDASSFYYAMSKEREHHSVNHTENEWVRRDGKTVTHTNGIEGFWSLLKRGILGINHQVSPKHLHRYCDEYCFRYNERTQKQDGRFSIALVQCAGRLKYKDLINRIS